MAAAKGNQYAARERAWSTAIDAALEERGKELGRMGALKELAHVLLDKCAEGDMTALKELGDRKDGKVPQAVNVGLSDEPDNPIQHFVGVAEDIRAKIRGGT